MIEQSNGVDFSIISVYNDRSTVEEMLLESLETELSSKYECILLDNRGGEYQSAAEALNDGAKEANGQYYLFVHQDVFFTGENWLGRVQEELDSLNDIGIAGVAGMATDGFGPYGRARNTLLQGEDRSAWRPGSPLETSTKVQTMDECCFIVPSTVFYQHQLNEEICDGWHLYAVEYALRMRERTEYEAYVLPVNIWHGSKGMLIDESYYKALQRLAETYDVDRIYTTCGTWPTNRKYQTIMITLYQLMKEKVPKSIEPKMKRLWPKIWGGGLPMVIEIINQGWNRISKK